MIDAEKVIKGLEVCEPSKYTRKCSSCPYKSEMNCDYVLWHDALELLKYQQVKINKARMFLTASGVDLDACMGEK